VEKRWQMGAGRGIVAGQVVKVVRALEKVGK